MTADAAAESTSRFLYNNGLCIIGGFKFRCISIRQHHVVNQIPVAEIVVMPDDSTTEVPNNIKDIYTQLFTTKKGDDVFVFFEFYATPEAGTTQRELDNELVTVFRGVLLGWAPVWIGPTSFRMTIWAIHPLGMLDWASSIIDSVHGSGFDDYKLPTIIGKTQELVPYMKGAYTASAVSTDLWKNLIKKELINICKSQRFGNINNDKLAKYLEDAPGQGTDGSESPLSLNVDNPARVILDIRRRLYTTAPGRKTLWDILVELSNIYKFCIICRGVDYSIAPIVPALGSRSKGLPKSTFLYWHKHVPREEYNFLVRDIAQSIGVLRGTGGATGFFDIQARRRQQEFRYILEEPVIAGTDYFTVPSFLDFDGEPFFKTANSIGLRSDILLASGYKLNDTVSEAVTLNKQYNEIPTKDLKAYADFLQNERAFSGPTAVLRGVVNYNVSPGNTVVAEPPLLYQTGEQFTDMLVGLVWGVTTVLDASNNRSANTYIILSHVRTSREQATIEMETHPLYDKRWISAPLIQIPGYTEAPHNA